MSFWRRNREADIRKQVHETWLSLSEDEIDLLDLHYCVGQTIPQIAEFLEMTNDEVEKNLQQASANFQKRLKVPAGYMEGLSVGEILNRYLPQMSDEKAEKASKRVWANLEKEMDKLDLHFRDLYRNGQDDGNGLRDLQVLAAIDLLGRESTFERVSAIVKEWSSRDVESRFVQGAVDRLHDRALITSHFPDTPNSNEAPGRFFKLTSTGQDKLAKAPKQALARVKGDKWDRADDSAWRDPL